MRKTQVGYALAQFLPYWKGESTVQTLLAVIFLAYGAYARLGAFGLHSLDPRLRRVGVGGY